MRHSATTATLATQDLRCNIGTGFPPDTFHKLSLNTWISGESKSRRREPSRTFSRLLSASNPTPDVGKGHSPVAGGRQPRLHRLRAAIRALGDPITERRFGPFYGPVGTRLPVPSRSCIVRVSGFSTFHVSFAPFGQTTRMLSGGAVRISS